MRYPPCNYTKILYHSFAKLPSRDVQWLWPGWLALGKLTLFEGDPGLGKSCLTLDLCARLSTGRKFPDSSKSAGPCKAIVLTAEDDVTDIVKPRLRAMNADLNQVFFLEGVADEHGEDAIRFPRHAQALHELLLKTGAKLVVIDPLVAYLEGVASHNDQSVRRVLALFRALAERHQCAFVLIRHLNKKEGQRSLYRGGGSIGFLAAVRCVWLAAADPKDSKVSVLAQVKNNLRALQTSLRYQIRGTEAEVAKLAWLGSCPLEATQLMGKTKTRGRPRTESERAEENLRYYLEEGPRTRSDILDFIKDQKISEKTLKRAKKSLGVRSVWVGTGPTKAIFWLLPKQVPHGVDEKDLVVLQTEEQEGDAIQLESEEWFRQLGRN